MVRVAAAILVGEDPPEEGGGHDKERQEHREVRDGQPVPGDDERGVAVREGPEDEEREGVDAGEHGREAVRREVVRRVVRRRPPRVPDQGRDVDLDEV